jgi:phage tail sheath protein FI
LANFLSPDVIVQEVQGQSNTIPIPSTSTFAMSGYSPRGPEGKALTFGSLAQFFATFGGFNTLSYIPFCAAAYYQNGGNQLAFVRQLHSDATFASGSFVATWDVQALGRGVWADGGQVTLSGNPSYYTQSTASYSAFDVSIALIDSTTGLLTTEETFKALDLVHPTSSSYIATVMKNQSETVKFTANTGGIPAALQPTSVSNIPVGTGDGHQTSFDVDLSAYTPMGPTTVKILVDAVQVATDDGLGNITSVSGVTGTINYTLGTLHVVFSPAPDLGDVITTNLITAPASGVTITLSGGTDGSQVTAADVVGAIAQSNETGIYAFDTLQPLQMSLALPDFVGDPGTDSTLLGYASTTKSILIILTPPQGSNAASAVNYKRNILASQSSYGAMYWPWVNVPDPLNNNYPKLIPAHGHIAGRYAYTDQTENVGKSPSGVNRGQLSFISSLERLVTQNDRDTVYPAQINPLRSDAAVGTAIWGDKTLQVVGDYTSVNVRRSFTFLELAQQAGLVDILFENIGPVTFSLIKARLDAFLENQYILGVIGSGVPKKEQAFLVVCDGTNNPQSLQEQQIIQVNEYIKPNISAQWILLLIQKTFDATQISS